MNEEVQSLQVNKTVFALDCPDALELARFYARLLGWQVNDQGAPEWVKVVAPGGQSPFDIACQQIGSYKKPTWPEGPIPQQAHLDFWVDSIEESTPIALAAGADLHPVQPGADYNWRVFCDPVGHLFCLVEHQE